MKFSHINFSSKQLSKRRKNRKLCGTVKINRILKVVFLTQRPAPQTAFFFCLFQISSCSSNRVKLRVYISHWSFLMKSVSFPSVVLCTLWPRKTRNRFWSTIFFLSDSIKWSGQQSFYANFSYNVETFWLFGGIKKTRQGNH